MLNDSINDKYKGGREIRFSKQDHKADLEILFIWRFPILSDPKLSNFLLNIKKLKLWVVSITPRAIN